MDQMFKFISQYKFVINENVRDNLKCGKCKNILINAYSVPCGCSYCCDCIDEMLNNHIQNCAGKNEDCRFSKISSKYLDVRINREISNFVIKCPEEMCSYECAIINMEDHVRVCENKSVKCPFANDGCDGKKIAREMLNDHCQSANFNHCKIIIEIIDNMKNEINILKLNDEKRQLKIENLENNLKSKDEIIEKINEEINLIKLEKEAVKQEFDSFKENFEMKLEKINRTNAKVKIENGENKRECNRKNENLKTKTKEIFADIQKEKQDRIKSINEIQIETKKKSEMMETRINKLIRIIGMKYPLIEWRIDSLNARRKQGGISWSENFTGMIKPYQLRLTFYANGTDAIQGRGCSNYLRIYSGENDQFLSWPFSADVTIKMTSKTDPNINKSVTKYCKIDKPSDNSFNRSESFNYLYCDLTKDGGRLDDCFIIECFVDFK